MFDLYGYSYRPRSHTIFSSTMGAMSGKSLIILLCLFVGRGLQSMWGGRSDFCHIDSKDQTSVVPLSGSAFLSRAVSPARLVSLFYIFIYQGHINISWVKRGCKYKNWRHPALDQLLATPSHNCDPGSICSMPIWSSLSEHIPVSLAPGATLQVPPVSHGRLKPVPENLLHPEASLGNLPPLHKLEVGDQWLKLILDISLPGPVWWSSIPWRKWGEGKPHRVGPQPVLSPKDQPVNENRLWGLSLSPGILLTTGHSIFLSSWNLPTDP